MNGFHVPRLKLKSTTTEDAVRQSAVGIGMRFSFAEDLISRLATPIDFIEVSPENYVGVGGRRRRIIESGRERFPVVSHGLCGDFAGAADIDRDAVEVLRGFLQENHASWYSDHLCMTHAGPTAFHDLLPLPFNAETVRRAARRIADLQSELQVPLAVENISAYMRAPGTELEEEEFVTAVVEEADCGLLLDVNNIYVNAQNFDFDPKEFLTKIPLDRVFQIHVAGHMRMDDGLVIDTHGAPVVQPVYDLLEHALTLIPHAPPILLERDHDIPPLHTLEDEVREIQKISNRVADKKRQATAA